MQALNEVYHKDAKLGVIMLAPTLSSEDKSSIIAELQKHTGGVDKGDTVKNFLEALAENNRLGLLKGVCEKFSLLMGASRGEVELIVTSATVGPPFGELGFGQALILGSNWMARLFNVWRLQCQNPHMLEVLRS
jgi:hypothetical protein